jgi:hypothetical protein
LTRRTRHCRASSTGRHTTSSSKQQLLGRQGTHDTVALCQLVEHRQQSLQQQQQLRVMYLPDLTRHTRH